MRTFIVFSALAIIAAPIAAASEVSGDLVFCSKTASPRERIACYDAAARIAANAGRRIEQAADRRAPAAQVITREAAGHPVIAPEPRYVSRFQGLYAALGGSYGFSNPRSVNVFATNGGLSDTISAKGPAGKLTLGYNATLGHFLLGAEIAGRLGNESVAAETATITTTPSVFSPVGTSIASYSLKNDAGLHIAARAGLTFDQTLVFLRAGVGASHITETAARDERGLNFCTAFTSSLGCTAFQSGTLTAASKSNWIPSAVIGAGIEHNIGPFFARVEGEIESLALHQTIFPSVGGAGAQAEPYWFARVMASAGVRF